MSFFEMPFDEVIALHQKKEKAFKSLDIECLEEMRVKYPELFSPDAEIQIEYMIKTIAFIESSEEYQELVRKEKNAALKLQKIIRKIAGQ